VESDDTDDHVRRRGRQTDVEPPPGFGRPVAGGPLQPLPTPSPWLLGILESYKLWKLLRQRLARMCQLVLPDEEAQTIRYVMYGQRRVLRPLLSFFPFRSLGPRMIVVTDNHVWVIRVWITWIGAGTVLGLPFLTPPRDVIARLPRETRIGPVRRVGRGLRDARRWGRTTIGGEEISIAPRYLLDVEAADSEVTE
jgi:hypothetical protein